MRRVRAQSLVGPKVVLPIHTEHPEAFESPAARVHSPELRVPIDLP